MLNDRGIALVDLRLLIPATTATSLLLVVPRSFGTLFQTAAAAMAADEIAIAAIVFLLVESPGSFVLYEQSSLMLSCDELWAISEKAERAVRSSVK